jgi:mannose-6-phosphate isomerase-like protein (cupin superfamily)
MTGLTPAAIQEFERRGFVGPIPLLTRAECRSLVQYLAGRGRPAADGWGKGAAVTDWVLYRIAADPRLLDIVKAVLGEDVVLWGCSVVRKHAGEVHPWHVDIETSLPSGHYATVWIGLENSRRNGALELIAGSHAAGKTIQQIQSERGYRRGESPLEEVLGWARELNAEASLARPELDDGDALLFDGRIWHGSRNARRTGTRTALLLQFASSDSPVRMHDEAQLDWPFKQIAEPKPPTIVLHGVGSGETNRLVPPPMPKTPKGRPMLSTCVTLLNLPLEEQPGGGWRPYQLFGGSTRILDHMNCHASVLSAGCCPHPPHVHDEEELLVILDGEAELIIADRPFQDGARVERVGPGTFAYYPAHQHHTIRNPGPAPLTYMMFKWHVDAAKAPPEPIGTGIFHYAEPMPEGAAGWITQPVMEGSTSWLGKLHSHASWLLPGAGYEAHVDAYDVAILTLSGRIETLGQEVLPNSVVYYAAGEKHGLRNVGHEPAHYLVFEFHSSAIDLTRRLPRKLAWVTKQAIKRAALAVGVDLGQLRERMRGRG